MPKDVLLYGEIWSEPAKKFFESVNTILDKDESSEVRLRINTNGGEPHYMMGILNKIQELNAEEGIVDGMAYSAGFYACCLIKNVDGVEGSLYLIHRASTWVEKYPEMYTDAVKKIMTETNAFLRKILKAKIDVSKFEKIAKKTIDEIFSMEGTLDVVLNAKQAQEVGLIRNVVPMTPGRRNKITAFVEQQTDEQFKVAAKKILKVEAKSEDEDEDQPISKPTTSKLANMTLEKLKTENPALYQQVLAEGKELGIKEERDNVAAWMAYIAVDAKRVVEAIKKGDKVTASVMAEMQVAMTSADYLKNLQASNAPALGGNPQETAQVTAKQKEIEKFNAEVSKALGKKPEAVK